MQSLSCIRAICLKWMDHCHVNGGYSFAVYHDNHQTYLGPISINSSGMLEGLQDLLLRKHRLLVPSWSKQWEDMRVDGTLQGHWDDGLVSLMDFVKVVVLVNRCRRQQSKSRWKAACGDLLADLQLKVLEELTTALDRCVASYCESNALPTQIPSRRFFGWVFSALEFLLLILNKPEKYTGLEMCEDDNVCWPTHIPKDRTNVRLSRDGGHQVTKMNLNEIWQFMEDARVNHWSLVELAKVRERERIVLEPNQGLCTCGQGKGWPCTIHEPNLLSRVVTDGLLPQMVPLMDARTLVSQSPSHI